MPKNRLMPSPLCAKAEKNHTASTASTAHSTTARRPIVRQKPDFSSARNTSRSRSV